MADVVDFEVFLDEDEKLRRDAEGEARLDECARAIYRERIQPLDRWRAEPRSDSAERRRVIFHAWLDARRERAGFKPGEWFESARAQAAFILAVLGFVCGGLDAKGASYFGALRVLSAGVPEPANVVWYLGGCVLLPALFVIVAVWLLAHFSVRSPTRAALFQALAGTVSRLMMMHTVDAPSRARLRAAMGLIVARLREQRAVLKWPFFLTLQSFGVAFAAGVTITTLVLMAGSDRGFGWQTSMEAITPARVADGVRLVSLPWRWMPFAWAAQPDAGAILGSQVTYISGGRNLADAALKLWWPFLVMCSVVYGLLPRLALFALAARAQRRALALMPLDDLRCERLFERLTRPGLVIKSPATSGVSLAAENAQAAAPLEDSTGGVCVVLASCDVREVVEKHADIFAERCGRRIQRAFIVGESAAGDREVLAALPKIAWQDGRPRLLYLQDASAPPILGILDFLRQCRTAAGERSQLNVALIGTPEPNAPAPAPRAEDAAVWRRKIDALGDARIGMLRLPN